MTDTKVSEPLSVVYAVQSLDETGQMRAPYLLCKGFASSGWDVRFRTLGTEQNKDLDNFWGSVAVERVPGRPRFWQLVKLAGSFLKPRKRQIVISWVWDWHCFALAAAKVLFRQPYAIVMDTYTFKASRDRKANFREELRYGFVLRNADVILAETPQCFDHARRLLPRPQTMLVPSGFWEKDLRTVEHRSGAQGAIPRRPVILYVGRIIERKGLHDLVSAFRQVSEMFPDWSVEIYGPVGDEAYFGKLQEQVRDLNLQEKVYFRPPVYGEELYRLYQETAIFALPSSGEGFPSVIVEAMYFGGTIAAAASGYVAYQLADGECGLLHAPGNVPELSRSLARLMSSEELRADFRAKARARMLATFTWDKYFLEIEREFRRLLN